MEIHFRNNNLQKQYEKSKEAVKAYGAEVARKCIMRVNILKVAKNIDELYSMPCLKFHPLRGSRGGEFSIYLTGFYRLIITRVEERFDAVRIEEINKHYGD